jgi:hypothetical protein
MTIPARINVVTLGVRDVARATSFYEALGWRRSARSQDEISFFQLGGCVLGLFGYADLAADALLEPGDVPSFRGVTTSINLPTDADVDQALADAVAAGATLLKTAQRAEWGGYSGYFADPDGNAWEVANNPGWPIDDAGFVTLPE